jgi:hypothetical protein
LISNLRDQIDLETSSKRNLSDPKGAANMPAVGAKNFYEQLRRSVGHKMLLGECRRAVDQHH